MGAVIEAVDDGLEELLARASSGDAAAFADLFGRHRARLRRMVGLRLDRRLRGRVDASDVLQEAYLDAARQLPAFLAGRTLPIALWLRLVAGQRLARVHRQHLGASMRDAGREVSIHRGGMPEASSASLAERLAGTFTTASQACARSERQGQLQAALDRLDENDREIIALRHFEELTNGEAAEVLGLSKTAASNRYMRALARLQAELADEPGFFEATGPATA